MDDDYINGSTPLRITMQVTITNAEDDRPPYIGTLTGELVEGSVVTVVSDIPPTDEVMITYDQKGYYALDRGGSTYEIIKDCGPMVWAL